MKKEKNSIPDPILVIWQNQMKQAAQTPWLASLLLKRARHLQQRLAYFYRQLTSLPRRWRRRIQRGLAAGLVGAALLLAWGPTPSVHAANITVTANSSGLADDNECSLVEAITNANNDSQVFNSVGECDAGSGPDTITLAGNTYTYTTAYGGASALPNINSEITIEANNSTIERDSGASNFRIIRVNIAGDLTLNEATISGGAPGGSGGGLANYRGTVTINSSTISGNSSGSGGGLYNRNGTVTINNSTISGNSAPGGNGGGIINYAYSNYGTETATLTINNSAISGNVSTRGGGIENYSFCYACVSVTTTLNINNSTISGNTASSGFGTGGGVEGTTNGDVNNGASVITINNSTISNNTAGDSGGGISTREVNNYGNVDLTLNRSLISGNSAAVSGNEINITGSNGTITAANYNLFGHNGETIAEALNNFTAYGGTDITATRDGNTPTALGGILSASVGNNGGSTYTNALFVGSPAQDAVPVGVANDCLVGSSADQRGAARANGSESGTACDIGAYELHQCTTTPTAIALMAVSAIQQELANSGLWAGLLGLVGLLLGFVLGWLKRGEVAEAVAKEGGG